MKHTYILPDIILLAFTLTSCMNDMEQMPTSDHSETCFSTMIQQKVNNKAEATQVVEGSTFRFMLYQRATLNYKYTGSYIYDSSLNPQYLVAAALDGKGVFQNPDPTAGLNGVKGTYSIVAISPGLDTESFDNGQSQALITCPNRTNENDEDVGAVYANEMEEKLLGEYAPITISNPLKEIRSRISFEVRKDSKLTEDITVSSIKVLGAGTGKSNETLYYFPQVRQCTVPSGISNEMDMGTISRKKDENGDYYYSTNQKYILSGIYAPRNVATSILETTIDNSNVLDMQYLSMTMVFTQGSRSVSANLILNADKDEKLAELLPHTDYVFKVKVASSYIQLSVQISSSSNTDWETPSLDNAEIGDVETIQIGTFDRNNWNETQLPAQTIE